MEKIKAMKAMGIDPAKLTGIAFHGGALGFVLQTIPIDDLDLVKQVCRSAKDAGVTHAFVEDTYMGNNFATAKTLVEIRTHWMIRLKDVGIEPRSVAAMTWKTDMLPKEPGTKRIIKGRKNQKAAAMEIARSLLGLDPDDDNQGDAACIWDWGQRQLDLEYENKRDRDDGNED